MSGKLISYGVAIAIGILVAMAYHELQPDTDSPQSSPGIAQAIAAGGEVYDTTPMASLDIEAPGVTGTVEAFEEEGLTVLRIRVSSDNPTEVHGQLNNPDTVFRGVVNQSDSNVEGFLFAKANFSIASSTSKDFTLVISMPAAAEAVPDNDIQFVVTVNREVLFRGTLDL